MKVSKKSFREWWKECMGWTEYEPDQAQRALAESAWNFACEMQEGRISTLKDTVMELEEKLEIADKDIRYLKKRLKDANEDVAKIARDNVGLRKELLQYQEPTEERAVKYIATVNEVCEDEADAFYMGTLDDIMEWCEDWNHCINDVKFYRLGDEVRVSFVDMGKETRFGVGSECI
jgi:uncharacterized coiled-coil protein SlyX